MFLRRALQVKNGVSFTSRKYWRYFVRFIRLQTICFSYNVYACRWCLKESRRLDGANNAAQPLQHKDSQQGE